MLSADKAHLHKYIKVASELCVFGLQDLLKGHAEKELPSAAASRSMAALAQKVEATRHECDRVQEVVTASKHTAAVQHIVCHVV